MRNPSLGSLRVSVGHTNVADLSLRAPRPICVLALAIQTLVILFSVGCGAPGEPLPPSPPIPVAVSDLTARQAGDAVLLTFTMPSRSTRGERVLDSPIVEVFRGSFKPDGTPDLKSFRLVDTVPGTLVPRYMHEGKVQFPDPISPEQIGSRPGENFVYRVRTRVSEKKASADSNEVSVTFHAAPQRLNVVNATVKENGVELNWPAPDRTFSGQPLPAIKEYHIYRGELDASAQPTAGKDSDQVTWKSQPLQIGSTTLPEYLDSAIEYGKSYGYVVRTVIVADGQPVESSDSRIVFVTPRDIFPPAAPQGVVAEVGPGDVTGSLAVDLSWAISPEPDLAGYRVYRSDTEGRTGQLLTPDLLPAPAYRDTSIAPGRYWYTVTAVDRTGNESAPSSPVPVDAAQPSR